MQGGKKLRNGRHDSCSPGKLLLNSSKKKRKKSKNGPNTSRSVFKVNDSFPIEVNFNLEEISPQSNNSNSEMVGDVSFESKGAEQDFD